MKKLLPFMLFIILTISLLPFATLAVSELDENEKALMEKLETGLSLNEEILTLSEEYKNQAENYFLRNDVSISDQEFVKINKYIDETISIINKAKVSKIEDLPKSVKNNVVKIANKAAEALGLFLTYNYSNETITIKDGDQMVVAETSDIIKKTGVDVSPILYFSLTIVLAITICFVISKKAKLFVQK